MPDYSQGDLTQRKITIAKAQLWELIKIWVDFQANVESKYKKNDLRFSTYSKFQKRLFSYYLDLDSLSSLLDNPIVLEKDFGVTEFESKKDLILHHFIFNRWDFFVGMFSLFEDAVGLIFVAVTSPKEREQMKLNLSPLTQDVEIMDLLKKKFSEEIKDIRETLKKNETVIPLAKMLNKLVSLEYLETEDRKFCDFVSHLRNTLHSNGSYHSSSREYQDILGEDYSLKEGAILNFITMNRCINWSQRMVEVFSKIAECLRVDFILDLTVSQK